MSRTKKSRKPGGAPTAKAKLSKQELDNVEKRVRKKKGKQAGNRQHEGTQSTQTAGQSQANKDPRLGNKTPIALGKLVAKVEKTKVTSVKKEAPIAAVRIAEQSNEKIQSISPVLSVEEEIDAIEQDVALQSILAKQEDDIALTEQEVDYFNELMERHEKLSAELGYDDETSDEDEDDEAQDSEDDLWNKLDRSIDKSDFSDLEDK